ncbi:hypothetical protein EYF80_023093 [Liparis tanakae]|uniref:Uncharacterized protein n=1 Tax=Liparis tanakae TaxID=230148 RepID=A0A4Z2HP12_9TELE|nr:hypothetical protein EYF80_023093 [Liparis tanakae]
MWKIYPVPPPGERKPLAIYLHNGCILLCGNVLSWATPPGRITGETLHDWADAFSGEKERFR